MIKLKKINNIEKGEVPLEVEIKKLTRPTNELFNVQFPNIALFGKKEAGKTVNIGKILDVIVTPNTMIIVFAATIYTADMWQYLTKKWGKRMVKMDAIIEYKKGKAINHLEALIERLESPHNKKKYENTEFVVVFDDISDELRDKYIRVFLKKNRHLKCTTIISSQSVKDIEPKAISQLNYILLFRGIPDADLEHIAEYTRLSLPIHMFHKMYEVATAEPYNFLLYDVTDEKFRRNFNQEIVFDSNKIEDRTEENKEKRVKKE